MTYSCRYYIDKVPVETGTIVVISYFGVGRGNVHFWVDTGHVPSHHINVRNIPNTLLSSCWSCAQRVHTII